MNGLLHDVRYALRQLEKTPAFTAVAVMILALGISANTAIFSAIESPVLRRGAALVWAGLVLGPVASMAATRRLSSMLFAVRPDDPQTFLTVALLLVAVALRGCYAPARRATTLDPMAALRYE